MEAIAGITSNTVPWEILRAAGYSPTLMEYEAGPTPCADRFMEDVFDRRIRVIFDRLCSGAWKHLDAVVIPRTSEQEHKLYLYLREAARLHREVHMPRLYLYNLLHTRSTESYDYGLERTRQMIRDFGATDAGLQDAIIESNGARAAVREILKLRYEGRLNGSVALAMIQGFYTRNRDAFRLGNEEALRTFPNSPRILIKGASLHHNGLHQLVEKHGGYVVAEDDWRGSRAAGERDVRSDGDPATAIFEKYFYDTVSPRILSDENDDWFRRQIESAQIHGVLFYVPLEDDVVGWDYPRQLAFLQTRGIPNLLIRNDEPTPELDTQLSTFIDRLHRG